MLLELRDEPLAGLTVRDAGARPPLINAESAYSGGFAESL